MAYTRDDLQGALPLVASGKVRDLYEIDSKTLLFVATDRISAFDVVMNNVSLCLALYRGILCQFQVLGRSG
jgi:phosphoribosylaminoimidazole-succinocarboxamide synthase